MIKQKLIVLIENMIEETGENYFLKLFSLDFLF